MARVRIGIIILFVMSLMLSTVGTALADPFVGVPSLDPTDGRFVGLSGTGLSTLSIAAKYWIGIPSSQATFQTDIFDGDLGGKWDQHDPVNAVKTQFTLYADPNKTGDPTGKTMIAQTTSSSMTDNDWANLYNGPVHASAKSFSGNFFYLLVAEWDNSAASAAEFNAFKIRASGTDQVSITPNQTWAFVGAPINTSRVPFDPGIGQAGNTYGGQWDWFFYAPGTNLTIHATDCDADYRLDTSNPGNPPDDFLATTTPEVKVSPDIRYTIFQPDGSTILINNLSPSGDTECVDNSQAAPTGGVFHWQWLGVDGHNFVYIQLAYETLALNATPFPVGVPSVTPTKTPVGTIPLPPTLTPTPTKTPVLTPAPTLTPTPTNTSTPTSGGGIGGGGSTPPTNTPIATSTAVSTAIANTAVATSTSTPKPTKTPVIIPKLPATGEASFPLLPVLGAGAVLMLAGALARNRRAQV